MHLIDHIHRANNWDPSAFLPFAVAGQMVGRIRRDRLDRLSAYTDTFRVEPDRISLVPGLHDFATRTAAVDDVLRALRGEGEFPGWRDEPYPVMKEWGQQPLMQIERSSCPWFGVRAWGVHLNGYVRRRDGLHVWGATRARDKPTYPGQLDNLVAGGQPLGVGLMENLVKECDEEARIPANLARHAVPVGMISYCHQLDEGLKPDQQFCYDLELPEGFKPHNRDGEVESFQLLPAAEVMRIVRETFDFKFNCALVVIDFMIRHGVIDADSEPDYADLCLGLRPMP